MTWEMIGAFIFILIAAVAIGASYLMSKQDPYRPDKPNSARITARLGGVVSAGIAVLLLLIGSCTVVSTRNIGVVTTFGKPSGTLSNGFHLKAPWQSVTEMDGSIQIDWHKDEDPNGDNHGNALTVRLGNNSNAWTDTSVRWEIKLDAADDLFLQYKEFGNVRTNLVTRNLQTALNEVFAAYNPLATVTAADPAAPAQTNESKLPELAAQATKILQQKVGDQVTIFEVQIPTISFDGPTQDRINELNQQKAKTAIATESEATADAQNRANAKIAAGIRQDPNVLVSKCLDVVREKGGSVLGCWPGATGVVPTIPANGSN